MNKTYISAIVIILVVGGLFFVLQTKKSEAPVMDQTQMEDTTMTPGTTNVTSTTTTTTTTGGPLPPIAIKEFTVGGKNFSFNPSTITVNKGDTVRITFQNTEGMHDFKIDQFGAATKVSKSPDTEVIEFVASKTGSFEYYCSVGSHRAMGMKGTLIVK